MQFRCTATLIAVAVLIAGRSASAQYIGSAGLQRVAAADAPRHGVLAPVIVAEGSRVVGAAHGALVGAGVGAVAGLVVMALTPHSDHSEDAIGYIVGAAGGAFVGLLVGAAIGATRPRESAGSRGRSTTRSLTIAAADEASCAVLVDTSS